MITVVPANEASWDELQTVLGARGYAALCQCQRFKVRNWDVELASVPVESRAERLRAQTNCGNPDAETTSGLIARVDGEPVGWCAVEPRPVYPRLLKSRIPWAGRAEDKDDSGVWAVTCFITRPGYRNHGVSRELAAAAVDFARSRGARALEGYAMRTEPGKEITWGELHVGARSIFSDAGFTEVSSPTARRVVMRIDFRPGSATRGLP
jgi:GNAT superfamily N-acetyltransferase